MATNKSNTTVAIGLDGYALISNINELNFDIKIDLNKFRKNGYEISKPMIITDIDFGPDDSSLLIGEFKNYAYLYILKDGK